MIQSLFSSLGLYVPLAEAKQSTGEAVYWGQLLETNGIGRIKDI